MEKILIVKTGTTYASLRAVKGDFDDWVFRQLDGKRRDHVRVADVMAGGELPSSPSEFAGVIITGSHAMVTDHAAWSERTAEWLRKAVHLGVPTLGICYGHQLLAYALGGRVGDNPRGREMGTVVVSPTIAGVQDALLGGFQGPFKAHMCHQQSVLSLPPGAVPLAFTRKEPCAAFSFNGRAWGVQFHPEFDGRIMKVYVLKSKDDLVAQGLDVNEAFSSCMETGSGHEVFKGFLSVVDRRSRGAAQS